MSRPDYLKCYDYYIMRVGEGASEEEVQDEVEAKWSLQVWEWMKQALEADMPMEE